LKLLVTKEKLKAWSLPLLLLASLKWCKLALSRCHVVLKGMLLMLLTPLTPGVERLLVRVPLAL
jgi:hypothetical protein